MRTIKNNPNPIEYNTDLAKFPFGGIKNETDSEGGTPVVEEIYGDPLSNIYAILKAAGITPNEQQDNETNGYQFLEALQKLANVLNDIEQVMTLTGTVWSVPIDIDNLPNKYVFIARASEDYNQAVSYTFEGSGDDTYPLTSSTGFASGDTVLVVIDQAGVRAIGLAAADMAKQDVFTVFGTPVSYNDSAALYYEEDGQLLTDAPTIDNLQSLIRVAESNGTLLVYNIFILKGHALCFCYLPDVQTYKFFQFDLNDLAAVEAVTVSGVNIPTGSNNEPYAYADANNIYLTNGGGENSDDFDLAQFTYDEGAGTLTFSQSFTLDNTFTKTTNGVIQPNALVTFIAGELKKYNLGTGAESLIGSFNSYVGQLFRYNDTTYYTNGEVAKKWTV